MDLDAAELRARAFAAGFTYLPLRAFVMQMEALIDLVEAWTGLYAPTIARSKGPVVQMGPYRYRRGDPARGLQGSLYLGR